MRVDFYDKDLNLIDIASLDVDTSDFKLDSPTPKHERVDLINGRVTLGSSLEARGMAVTFHIRARDMLDFPLIRDEVFDLFNGLEFVYIVDRRNPAKRWKVKVESQYDTSPIATVFAKFDIEFTSDSPYAHSTGSTDDPLSFDEETWQFGQGLIVDDLTYDTTAHDFQIYNAGNVKIDPRNIHTPLTIEVTAAQTSSNITLSLTNNTTGETWSYTGPTTAGQIIQLKNVQTLMNGASVFDKTNFKLLTLEKGMNSISRNSGISRVKFIHRFYYK